MSWKNTLVHWSWSCIDYSPSSKALYSCLKYYWLFCELLVSYLTLVIHRSLAFGKSISLGTFLFLVDYWIDNFTVSFFVFIIQKWNPHRTLNFSLYKWSQDNLATLSSRHFSTYLLSLPTIYCVLDWWVFSLFFRVEWIGREPH